MATKGLDVGINLLSDFLQVLQGTTLADEIVMYSNKASFKILEILNDQRPNSTGIVLGTLVRASKKWETFYLSVTNTAPK